MSDPPAPPTPAAYRVLKLMHDGHARFLMGRFIEERTQRAVGR